MAPVASRGVKVLVTGSAGLIGSEAVEYFDHLGFDVHGVDNNMRADFFGPGGDTTSNRARLEATCARYTHHHTRRDHTDCEQGWAGRDTVRTRRAQTDPRPAKAAPRTPARSR